MNRTILNMLLSTLAVLLGGGGELSAAERAGIDELIRDLGATKPAARAHAAGELARIGPSAAPAVPELIRALSDESRAVRQEALLALERIGPAARAAVPTLIEILKSKDDQLHLGSVSALGAIGPDSAAAAPRLTEYLDASDERISVAAAYALARVLPGEAEESKRAIHVLVKGLQSKHRPIQNEAMRGLVLIGPSAVPELAKLIGNFRDDPHSAVAAAKVLHMLGSSAESAIPQLIPALSCSHDIVASTAADALGAMGSRAKAALPGLIKLLQSDHPLLRTHGAHNIGLLGADAQSAVGELARALRDKDFNVRREAAQSLGEIGPPAKLAVPDLIRSLQDESQPVVLAAAHALARVGPEAVPALISLIKNKRLARWAVEILAEQGEAAAPAAEALRAALANADEELAREIIMTLGRIGPGAKEAAPDLIKILEDKESKLRVPAAFALGNIRSPDAAAALKDLLEDGDKKNSRLSFAAAGALVLIESADGDHVELALPKLIAALQSKSESLRREAAAALRQIGPPAASAIPVLTQGLRDPNPAICIDYLWALTAISPKETSPELARELTREIVPLLTAPQPHVRYTACYALGSLGREASDAIPILENNLQDADTFLQLASAWALVRMSPNKTEIAEECIDPLVRGLALPDARARAEAATSLGLLGHLAQRAAPALEENRRDPDESVRKAVAEALERIRHGTAAR